MSGLLLSGIVTAGISTGALLTLPTWAFLSAPWNRLAARRTARPVHAAVEST